MIPWSNGKLIRVTLERFSYPDTWRLPWWTKSERQIFPLSRMSRSLEIEFYFYPPLDFLNEICSFLLKFSQFVTLYWWPNPVNTKQSENPVSRLVDKAINLLDRFWFTGSCPHKRLQRRSTFVFSMCQCFTSCYIYPSNGTTVSTIHGNVHYPPQCCWLFLISGRAELDFNLSVKFKSWYKMRNYQWCWMELCYWVQSTSTTECLITQHIWLSEITIVQRSCIRW